MPSSKPWPDPQDLKVSEIDSALTSTCDAPFEGIGAPIVSFLFGRSQSMADPRFRNPCIQMARKHPGGAEIEITMLFADIRGSTTLAEDLSPSEFSSAINRFYKAATEVHLGTDAFIDRPIGDEIELH